MKRLIILIAGLSLSVAAFAADPSIQKQVSTSASEALKNPQVTGITLALAKNDQIVFAGGFGLANIETKEPVTVDTKMRTGSVSKVYTTALIGRLIQTKQLNIDLPIRTYVLSFPKKRWPITVRQMSAHMGGIRHYRGNEFSSTKHYPTVLGGLEIFQNDPLTFQPGTQSQYSSYAWNLISAALEAAGEKPFLRQMQTDIFQKLGMTNTVAEDVTKQIANLASFHETRGTTTIIAPFVDNSYKWAGGGFIGTASDMAKFGLAHTRPGFLSADTLEVLRAEQQTTAGVDTGFGIGWMTASSMKRRLTRNNQPELTGNFSDKLMWHSGGSMGAVALLLVDPAEQSAVALMANNSGSFSTILELGLEALGLLQDK